MRRRQSVPKARIPVASDSGLLVDTAPFYCIALDELIDNMAERVKSHYNLDDVGDPGSMTEVQHSFSYVLRYVALSFVIQGEIIAVGRICSDSEEKPNESSLLLETSRIVGDGKRVPLQFAPQCALRSELPGRPAFNFFSGQIVALRGKNGNGLKYVVSEILAVCHFCLC